jgi:hypothetical protein
MIRNLVCGVLMLAVFGVVGVSAAVNGGFETGDYYGWNVTGDSDGLSGTQVVTSATAYNGTIYNATEGSYMAKLVASATISQSYSWNAGDTISFDWNFLGKDYVPYNDDAIFQITDSGSTVLDSITLADISTYGDYTATGWQNYSYMFTAAGSGIISYGVQNVGDTVLDSELLIDNITDNLGAPLPLAGVTGMLMSMTSFGYFIRRKNS